MFGELDTYSLIDFFPFTGDVYLRLFALQNEAWWPVHVFFFIAVLFSLLAIFVPFVDSKMRLQRWRSRALGVCLACAWTWVGVTFFLGSYADLNWASPYFGWTFLAQALAFAVAGGVGMLGVAPAEEGARGGCFWLGVGWVLLASLGYPSLALAGIGGRAWRTAEVIGLAPDPTVVLAAGLVMLARKPRLWLLLVPAAWSAASALTAQALELRSGFLTAALVGLGAVVATYQRFFASRAGVARRDAA